MESEGTGRIRWGAAALGWVVAVFSGLVIGAIARVLYGYVVGSAAERGEFTLAAVVISLFSGFLAYLVGGWVAGRMAGRNGGLNGAMTAVFGLALGLFSAAVLSTFGLVFSEGVALPPVGFGVTGGVLLAGLILFSLNLFGGFVGGKLGEPSRPRLRRSS